MLKYGETIYFLLKILKLLVLNNATTHKTSKVNDRIKECETALSVIPNDLKWRLRSLEISIRKSSKESVINKYVDYWIVKIIIRYQRMQL